MQKLSAFLFLGLASLALGTHVLEYFDIVGRAEAIRIALHAGGVEFTDKRFGWEEWQGFKAETSDTVYKNGLPVLTVGAQKFSQSLAQMRYAARKGNLYSDDLAVAMRIDEILDIYQDCLAKAPQASDEAEKKRLREEYAAGKMKAFMNRLNQLAEESTTPWLAGTKDISIADLGMWQLFMTLRGGNFDHVASDYIEAWPKLAALEKAVPEHAIVKAYYASLKKKEDL